MRRRGESGEVLGMCLGMTECWVRGAVPRWAGFETEMNPKDRTLRSGELTILYSWTDGSRVDCHLWVILLVAGVLKS